jgi:hypothetical protein
MNKLKLSPLPRGGRRFLPKTTSRKRQKIQFETFRSLSAVKNFGRHIQRHALASSLSNMTHTNLHYNCQKFKWPTCHFSFSLAVLGQIRSRVPGQSFVTKGSQSFTSDGIHQATFVPRSFASRGSRDSLFNGVVACLRRPISRGSVRP